MKRAYLSITSLLGALVLLGIAVLLDSWIDTLQQTAQKEFSGPFSWMIPANLAALPPAVLLLVWLWWVYRQDQYHRVVAIIYVLAGCGLLFYNVVVIALAYTLPLPILLAATPQSFSAFVSAVVAVVGLHKLFGRKAK